MSFKYPDFSKYFTGKQQLPTEIMMLIHDWGRAMLRHRGEQISLETYFADKPLVDHAVYDIAPRTSVILDSSPERVTTFRPSENVDAFISVQTVGRLYMEFHIPTSLNIIRRVHCLQDYSLISKEILLRNGKVVKRKLKGKFNKESFP